MATPEKTAPIVPAPKSDLLGDRAQVKEIGLRLRQFMPSAQNFTESEALAVAQIAYAHHLDPFNGEVWGIKGYDGAWKGVMVGIKGLRKCARREARKENATYWFELPRQVDPKKYDAPQNAVVYEMPLRDTASMQAYGKALNSLTSCGIPYAEAIQMIGQPPVVIGVGIATPEEKSKMPIHARAKKRGEADALKQKYSIEFGDSVAIADEDTAPGFSAPAEDATDAEYSDIPEVEYNQETAPKQEQPKRTEAQLLADLGFDASPAKSEVTETSLRADEERNKKKLAEARHHDLWRKVQDAGKLNQITVDAWKIRADDTSKTISEKCEEMVTALM